MMPGIWIVVLELGFILALDLKTTGVHLTKVNTFICCCIRNVSTAVCLHFSGWKTMYKNNLRKIVASQGLDWIIYGKVMVGGEATMWSEQADDFSVEAKLWPRGCAFAERLWSDPQETTWREAEQRLLEQRHVLHVWVFKSAVCLHFFRKIQRFVFIFEK